jgi:hypothetical protein
MTNIKKIGNFAKKSVCNFVENTRLGAIYGLGVVSLGLAVYFNATLGVKVFEQLKEGTDISKIKLPDHHLLWTACSLAFLGFMIGICVRFTMLEKNSIEHSSKAQLQDKQFQFQFQFQRYENFLHNDTIIDNIPLD